jgi:hypothetical protein
MNATTKETNNKDQSKIKPGLMVHARGPGEMQGAPGEHLGTVDHLDGDRYIKLAKKDSTDGEHHWIPLDWVDRVDDRAVYLNKTLDECRAQMFDSFPGERDFTAETPERKAV